MENGSKLLEDENVIQFFEEILGEEGINVIKALKGKTTTDEKIAEELGLKLNLVRKILYKLYDYRLASYVRTKDKDIGWYIYTWSLELPRVQNVITDRKRKILEDMTNKLEYETNTVFFECVNDRFRIPYDIASERGFKCPQCEGDLEFLNNQAVVDRLEREIRQLEEELNNNLRGPLEVARLQ